MSYSAFYSAALSIRHNLRAPDNTCLATNAEGTGDANAEETLICQRGGSGVTHEEAVTEAVGEPTINPGPVSRGHLRPASAIAFEF